MITSHGPIGASRMTTAAATKRMCSRNIDFTNLAANSGLGYVSTNITVTRVTLFVEVGIGSNLMQMEFGTEADADAIIASGAIIDPGPGAFVDIPLPAGGVDVDAGGAGHALLASVTVVGLAGNGQATIEYHERG